MGALGENGLKGALALVLEVFAAVLVNHTCLGHGQETIWFNGWRGMLGRSDSTAGLNITRHEPCWEVQAGLGDVKFVPGPLPDDTIPTLCKFPEQSIFLSRNLPKGVAGHPPPPVRERDLACAARSVQATTRMQP